MQRERGSFRLLKGSRKILGFNFGLILEIKYIFIKMEPEWGLKS